MTTLAHKQDRPLVTRKYCPGPWHSAIANHYAEYALAPKLGAQHVAKAHNLEPHEVILIVQWVNDKRRHMPCPVG